jgi:outer membrane lipoprotein-sorting protein
VRALRCIRFCLPLVVILVGACGRKAPTFPSGAGAAFPDFASAYEQAVSSCRNAKTMTASMALSGRAGRTKLRGRIDAGFAVPSRMRLEGRAPFGRPVFVLTADGDRATLVLPRDERVLANAPPDRIVEALAGIALGSDALRTIVAGCGLNADPARDGRLYGSDRAAVSFGSATAYLRRAAGTWRLEGSVGEGLTIFYSDFANGRPSTIRVRSGLRDAAATDVTLRLSDVEINVPLAPRTFQSEIPEHAIPLSLDELKQAGPLGSTATTKGTE